MKKTIVVAVVLGVFGAIGGRMALQSAADSQPPPRGGAPVVPPETVSANGTVEGARPEVALRPEVAGILMSVKVRENDSVEKGQIVAELSNEAQRAQVALAEAELVVAREQLKKLEAGERQQVRRRAEAEEVSKAAGYRHAEEEWKRLASTRSGVSANDLDAASSRMQTAKAEWDKAKADLALVQEGTRAEDIAVARGQVEVVEAKLRAAKAELAKTQLRAPTSGRILQVFAEPGELAAPTSAQPVVIMADLSRRRVRAYVEELDVDRVQAAQEASVTADGLPGKTFTGKVAIALSRMGKRAPQSDSPNELKDVYFREVLIDLDAGDELPTNLRVQVRIKANASVRQ
jgi:multidrug resistance efflux pump